jgi:hypothetical protein
MALGVVLASAICPAQSVGWSKCGQSFTRRSSRPIGSDCRGAGRLCRSLRYNNCMNGHPLHRVKSFDRVGAHTLRLEFADGSRQTIDFTPVLAVDLYGPLQDPELFGQVRLDPEVHTLVWPNGADFDPATLHDWP